MKIPLSQLELRARSRPPGYIEEVKALGTVHGNYVDVPDDKLEELRKKYANVVKAKEIPEPTITALASNFVEAIAPWIAAGFPMVTEEEHSRRAAICESCEFWDGLARFGLGKCKKCGCTKFKRFLANTRCVDGKWEAAIAEKAKP